MLEGIALGMIALFVIEFVLLFALVVWERPFSGLLSLAVFAAVLEVAFGVGVTAFAWANPVTLLVGVGAYILLGVAWSFPKWWFYVRKVRDEYLDNLTGFKARNRIPEDQKLEGEALDNFRRRYHKPRRPRASEHKTRILTWMMYWPFSFIWTMIDEPFKRAFEYIFRQLRGLYESISERAFAGVEGFDEDVDEAY